MIPAQFAPNRRMSAHRRTNEPKVLVIDNDQASVRSLLKVAEDLRFGFRVFVAECGEEALERLAAWSNTDAPMSSVVILLDMDIPKMSGLEFLSALRSETAFQAVHVFVHSRFSHDVDRCRAFGHGIAGYVIKTQNSVSDHQVIRRINAFLRTLA